MPFGHAFGTRKGQRGSRTFEDSQLRGRRTFEERTAKISMSDAVRALQRVSCSGTRKELESLFPRNALKDDKIDFYEFCQAAIQSRRKGRAAFRRNGGFTEAQVSELRMTFTKYDADKSGEIAGNETIQLFEKEFPEISNDPARRPQLLQFLQEADEDGNGALNLQDFLRIVRQVNDVQDQMRVSKELEAVSTTKFTHPEVQQFRELFLAAGRGMRELGFHEIQELLQCIIPMGAKNVEELRHKFKEMAAKQMGAPGDANMLDFPEFLWLMRELTDMNFANMNGRAHALVDYERADSVKTVKSVKSDATASTGVSSWQLGVGK
jgi:Ca2+-binding EF-hand superfamily protein